MPEVDQSPSDMKHTFTLLLLTGTFSASGQWLTDSLIAHFPMDGSPNDTVAGLVPVLTSGAPGFCADRHGAAENAACFDGSSFWSYGDTLDMDTADFSISAWLQMDTVLPPFLIAPGFTSEGSTPFGKGNSVFSQPTRAGYSVLLRNTGSPAIDMYGTTGDETDNMHLVLTSVQSDAWIHIVHSRCGEHLKLYVNGLLVADSIAPTGRDLNVNTFFTIGGLDRNPAPELDSEWFIGAIDDLRIYKGRCLSQNEIDVLADLTVGLNDRRSPLAELGLFPNPAYSTLRIELSASAGITGPNTVLNSLGQPIPLSALTVGLPGNGQPLTLDVSHLPKGAYFVVVPTEEGRSHGRFVKE